MAKILIVEDEISINELIRRNLQLVGHACSSVFSGPAALERLSREPVDLMLLDVMLPGLSGFEVYEQARQTPTIFLTAKSGLPDRVRGLTMGADDYISKPFEMLELLARVEAVLRRTMKSRACFELDGMKIDFDSRQVFLRGSAVDCTPKEYALLETLVNNRNIALSRERLLELVWGYDFEGDTRTVDVHIQKLRKKLELEGRIKTVYKLGYRLEAAP
ncbi:response regulator transcription factor [Allofournierella sp.]|uniref:response regulator transcription factor n=1 Tax=Allofournierella sp. TaxID=1940256 RepID=UPI003AB1D7FD